MPQLTERSRKWMEGVKANFAKASGKPVEAWVKLARTRGYDRDPAATRKWLRGEHQLTTVQTTFILSVLFEAAEPDEGDLLAAQFAGPKASLRPVYERLERLARGLGKDVMVAPRKSQVTFARDVTFAVVRAATRDRLDLMLRLPDIKGTARLKANARAAGSDPTHVVALRSTSDVDGEVERWMRQGYQAAAR